LKIHRKEVAVVQKRPTVLYKHSVHVVDGHTAGEEQPRQRLEWRECEFVSTERAASCTRSEHRNFTRNPAEEQAGIIHDTSLFAKRLPVVSIHDDVQIDPLPGFFCTAPFLDKWNDVLLIMSTRLSVLKGALTPDIKNFAAGFWFGIKVLSRRTSIEPNQKLAMSEAISGVWKPSQLQQLWYGPESVQKHLLECLPSPSSKAFIITGSSIAKKTTLSQQVERLLGRERHGGTFSGIKQHAPVAE
jgi:hypothetical protein